jgi:hypothetical protein
MFSPRHQDKKRSGFLPQVRVTPEEREAAEWLAERLSQKQGFKISLADVVRVALEELYAREQTEAAPESKGKARNHPVK